MSDNKEIVFCQCLAEIVRERRKGLGLSMNRLAERCGLSQQSVSYLERKKRAPNIGTLLRVADALDTDLSELIRATEGRMVETIQMRPKVKLFEAELNFLPVDFKVTLDLSAKSTAYALIFTFGSGKSPGHVTQDKGFDIPKPGDSTVVMVELSHAMHLREGRTFTMQEFGQRGKPGKEVGAGTILKILPFKEPELIVESESQFAT